MIAPFEIVKEADSKLADVPVLPAANETPQFSSVTLDAEHERLLGWLTAKALGNWDGVASRLNTHTHALKQAHDELGLKGSFETLSTGSTEQNCFAHPKRRGAWHVCRHGKGVQEHPSWRKSANGWTCCDFNKKPDPKTKDDPAAIIVKLATDGDELFHSHDGSGYVQTKIAGQYETLLVREERYRHILRLRFTRQTSKIAKADWLRTAQDQLEAIATQEGPAHQVFLRVGSHEGKVYLDLADSERRVVEISKAGWQLKPNPPIRFRRPATMMTLPEPKHGGNASILQPFFNVREEDWPTLLGALVMCLHPRGPYPIVALIGRGGCAKSTTARVAQQLIDPTQIDGSALPATREDLIIRAQEGWLVTFDNLSKIDQEMSDTFCRLSTGAALTRRTLYSDSGLTLFRAKRPVVLTSINNVVSATDMLDRTVLFELPALSKRKKEEQFDLEFEAVRAQGLGALLDGAVAGLKNEATVKIDDPPRMCDFAFWASAAESGLGLQPGKFMASYRANLADVRAGILDNELARQIVELATFKGTAKELAARLEWTGLDDNQLRERIGKLRMLAPALEGEGVQVTFHPKSHGRRLIEIQSSLARQMTVLAKAGFKATVRDLSDQLGWTGLDPAGLKTRIGELRKLRRRLKGQGVIVVLHPKSKGERLIEIRRPRQDP